MVMNWKSSAALLVLPVLILAAACDQASPVAPEGTTLTVTATPSQIATSGEASTIRVTGVRPNGTPLFPGTQVRLETTLGTIDPIVEIGSDGVGLGALRGDGRIGTATVTARTGTSDMAIVEVEIGKFAANITLQASPGQVADSGGNVSLLAVVRDDQGRALAGSLVNFQTEVGTLDSRGALKTTNASGEARDTLRVSEADIASFNAPSFTVRATVGGGTGGTQQATATIRILAARPIADFTPRAAGEFKVFFENITQGQRPIDFEWDFQNDGTIDSTVESPTFDYGSATTVIVWLTATNAFGTSTKFRTINVLVL